MRACLAAALVAVAVTAAAAAPAVKNPCAIVTSADAAAVLEAPVGPAHARALRYRPPLHRPRHPMTRYCMYTARARPSRDAIVITGPLTHSAFALVIAQQPYPVTKVAGLGGLAYIAGPHRLLMAWKHGTALYVSVSGTASPVASEKRLARRALGRL